MNDQLMIEKLNNIQKLLEAQALLRKDVLNFNETTLYLDLSESHLYKLTSKKQIPHYCPQGKRLYFKRAELDSWLQRNRKSSSDELERQAIEYVTKTKRRFV